MMHIITIEMSYINDLSYSVPPEVSTKCFADDLKTYVSVAHGHSEFTMRHSK